MILAGVPHSCLNIFLEPVRSEGYLGVILFRMFWREPIPEQIATPPTTTMPTVKAALGSMRRRCETVSKLNGGLFTE